MTGFRFVMYGAVEGAILVGMGCSYRPVASECVTESETAIGSKEDALMVETARGREVLEKTARTYMSLRSYIGITVVDSQTNYENTSHSSRTTAKVTFSRPRIRIEGSDSNGDRIETISGGSEPWVLHATEASAEYQKRPSMQDAIFEYQGATRGAFMMIPSCLLGIEWSADDHPPWIRGQVLKEFAKRAVLDGSEKTDGHECFRTVCNLKECKWTIWVDKNSYLLRKAKQEVSKEQMYWGRGLSGRIQSWVSTEVYKVESVDKEIDLELFKLPKK